MSAGSVKIYRGCLSRCSKDKFIERLLASVITDTITPGDILNKICENISLTEANETLQSFSTDRKIAENNCGTHGWIVELEVEASSLIYPQAILESLKTKAFIESDQETVQKCEDALNWSSLDSEVFLRGKIERESLLVMNIR